MLKNKLQIFLITYNRQKKLKLTLESLLKSPVADFDITVLDNASTDGTSKLLDEYAQKHKNITHIRHKTNIGGNANICRAFEMGAASGKDYVWVLCDDDKYDFSNWSAVEQAIKQNADIVCLADYIYPDKDAKSDPAYQIFQLTFVPAGIYRTSLITDTVLINMYDSIYTMFSQSCITINAINNGANIVVLDKPIVFNGLHFEEKIDFEDVCYSRGSADKKQILARRRDTVWILGFCNIVSLVKDKELQKHCIEISIPYKDIYNSWNNFYNCIISSYLVPGKFNYFYEIYKSLPETKQSEIMKICRKDIGYVLHKDNIINGLHRRMLPRFWYKKLIKNTFSIDVSLDGKYRILKLFGLTIKLHRIK